MTYIIESIITAIIEMNTTAAVVIAFILGCLFMIAVRTIIYGLSLFTVKKGEKLKTKGEEISKEIDELMNNLQSIQEKLNGR